MASSRISTAPRSLVNPCFLVNPRSFIRECSRKTWRARGPASYRNSRKPSTPKTIRSRRGYSTSPSTLRAAPEAFPLAPRTARTSCAQDVRSRTRGNRIAGSPDNARQLHDGRGPCNAVEGENSIPRRRPFEIAHQKAKYGDGRPPARREQHRRHRSANTRVPENRTRRRLPHTRDEARPHRRSA